MKALTRFGLSTVVPSNTVRTMERFPASALAINSAVWSAGNMAPGGSGMFIASGLVSVARPPPVAVRAARPLSSSMETPSWRVFCSKR